MIVPGKLKIVNFLKFSFLINIAICTDEKADKIKLKQNTLIRLVKCGWLKKSDI